MPEWVHVNPERIGRDFYRSIRAGGRVKRSDFEGSNRTTILVHYYRAMVGRADVWRTRMDATSNWAIAATAAIVSFALSDAAVPHYVISIALLMTTSLLLLEARRLTFYHLFQTRVLLLEDGLMRPALSPEAFDAVEATSGEAVRKPDLARLLDSHLGRTIPTMPIGKAIARRLRRVYLYVFGVQLFAWLLKLANHPTPVRSFDALIERAELGILGGGLVIALVLLLALGTLLFALVRGGVDRDTA